MGDEIIVDGVSEDRKKVYLWAGGVKLGFVRESNGKITVVSRSTLSQTYNRDACRVSKRLFNAACQKAGAILAR